MQKQLHKTLMKISSGEFKDDIELFSTVIKQLISDPKLKVTGGRVWQLSRENKVYQIYYQIGEYKRIEKDFSLNLDEEVIQKISTERTITSLEVNKELLAKGIFEFSASGFSKKVKINGKNYYKYILALNTTDFSIEFKYVLNVVSTLLTSRLTEWEIKERKEDLQADINQAKKLQRSILPEHEYNFSDYDIYGVTSSAKELSGDFFDYLKIGEGEERLGIVVGDVASKGLVAAAEAMYISGAIRMSSHFQIKISPFMSRLNNLINQIFSDDRFVTMFYGELSEDKKGLFLYSNAGHNPPIFIDKKMKVIELNVNGPLLGPVPHSKYGTDSIYINSGDLLAIYSDGIVEAANEKFHFYGKRRLVNLLKMKKAESPKIIALSILDDVIKFSSNDSQYQDDKTIVVIKRN